MPEVFGRLPEQTAAEVSPRPPEDSPNLARRCNETSLTTVLDGELVGTTDEEVRRILNLLEPRQMDDEDEIRNQVCGYKHDSPKLEAGA